MAFGRRKNTSPKRRHRLFPVLLKWRIKSDAQSNRVWHFYAVKRLGKGEVYPAARRELDAEDWLTQTTGELPSLH